MRSKNIFLIAAVILLIVEATIWKATANDLRIEPIQPSTDTHVNTEHIPPAYTAEQAQASALAMPSPIAAKPSSLVIVTVCNQIVGIVAADTEGNIHPLNIEGLGDARLKSIIERVPQRIVVDAGCQTEPDRQPIF